MKNFENQIIVKLWPRVWCLVCVDTQCIMLLRGLVYACLSHTAKKNHSATLLMFGLWHKTLKCIVSVHNIPVIIIVIVMPTRATW